MGKFYEKDAEKFREGGRKTRTLLVACALALSLVTSASANEEAPPAEQLVEESGEEFLQVEASEEASGEETMASSLPLDPDNGSLVLLNESTEVQSVSITKTVSYDSVNRYATWVITLTPNNLEANWKGVKVREYYDTALMRYSYLLINGNDSFNIGVEFLEDGFEYTFLEDAVGVQKITYRSNITDSFYNS